MMNPKDSPTSSDVVDYVGKSPKANPYVADYYNIMFVHSNQCGFHNCNCIIF